MAQPSPYELQHAVRYATEHCRLFVADAFRKRYPDVSIRVETRPATRQDYYCPPTLQCIVVTRLAFTEEGCDALSCFPYKEDGAPCTSADPLQWSAIGSNALSLSCQSACHRFPQQLDTHWWEDRCQAVNPLKKLMAIFPERAFGLESKHPFHSGLDWVRGHVYLNRFYCAAYGLEFRDRDCYSPWGQSMMEFLVGKTVVRVFKPLLQAPRPSYPALPPQKTFDILEETVSDLVNEPSEPSQVAKDIAQVIALDFGIDLTARGVENLLRKKAPKLILRAAKSIPVKSALTQAVLREAATLSAQSLKTLGKTVKVARGVFTVYSVFAVILDVIDPLNYDYVLTAKALEKINDRLDLMYFRRENEHTREITPDMVWEETEQFYEYMAEKIEEYLTALRAKEIDSAPRAHLFDFQLHQKEKEWFRSMQVALVIMLGTCAIVFVDWIHVWGAVLFFVMIIVK